jgi:outer membrane protein OmpA-like peptidoglycan-associated protein
VRPASTLIPLAVLLGSCSSPPKPPTVDESSRRPANSASAVELQVCRSDLHNTRIVATESDRLAASANASLERIATLQRALVAAQKASAPAPLANKVFTVRFDFGSSRLVVPADIAASLADGTRTAPLVVLRGRTDGTTESLAESRIARERAGAVRNYLIGIGVEPTRIRATYQPVGDYASDNTRTEGRDMNRRVEIELYRALPVANVSPAAALPLTPAPE